MKLFILTPLFAAALVQAQFNAMLALLKTFKLTAPLECAMPCILESANKMPWDEAGPASAICSNIDKIAEDTKPCTQKCNSDKANDFAVELARWVCSTGQATTNTPDGAETVKEDGREENTREL